LAAWPLERKVLGYGPRPQILKEPKVLVPIPFWHFRVRINPKSKLIQVREGDGSVPHPINKVLTHICLKVIPACDPGHQPPKTMRPSLSPSRFVSSGSVALRNFSANSKNSCCLRFSASMPFSMSFNQHAVGTQPAILGEVADLSRDLNGEADALTNSLISRAHSTSMHHNGVFAHTILESNGYRFMRGPARLGGDHRVCRGRASNIRRREGEDFSPWPARRR